MSDRLFSPLEAIRTVSSSVTSIAKRVYFNASQWRFLSGEIKRRTFKPLASVSFVLFVLVALCALGGLGIWIEWLRFAFAPDPKDVSNLTIATLTFFPPIIGTATFQLILERNSDYNKILSTVSISMLVLFMMTDAALAYISYFDKLAALRGGIICSILSVYMWWLMNADSNLFSTDIDASLGGSVSAKLAGEVPSDFIQ